jgi:hypothetical protein
MNRIVAVLVTGCVLCGARLVQAQHPMHGDTTHARRAQPDTGMMMMMMVNPLGVPMERMGSGTTWIPDAVPVPARHHMAGSWLLMLHGFAFVQYDAQGGPRGDDQFGSLNWAMVMASRDWLGGRLQGRAMLSLDPATVTNRGYPLLLQTGESYKGQPLVDRQHPHDFWMELAAMYERALSSSLGLELYAAPSGEPALGPVAFMHRPSAMDNPLAPLGHHWQDATHISFGVLTAGIFGHHWKLEGSAFNGREPDEERWGFDPIHIDSYSGRFSAHVDSNWTVSVGYGYLKSPEALNPTESVHRTTASVLHGRKIGHDGQFAAALVWGANRKVGKTTQSLLGEAEAVLDRENTIYGRAELVQKTAEDLAINTLPPETQFDVTSISAGYIREVFRSSRATFGVGLQVTFNHVPGSLESLYGSRTPVGGLLLLRVRPIHGPHRMNQESRRMDAMRHEEE